MVSRWSPKPEAGVRFSSPLPIYLGIAQSGSASGLGPEGRRFESYYRDQISTYSSVGQSSPLITGWSLVRVQVGAPLMRLW